MKSWQHERCARGKMHGLRLVQIEVPRRCHKEDRGEGQGFRAQDQRLYLRLIIVRPAPLLKEQDA